MWNDNETLKGSVGVLPGTIYRPTRPVANPIKGGNMPLAPVVQTLQSQVTPVGGNNTGTSGIKPKQVLSLSATESPAKVQGRTLSEVSVSFTRDGNDKNFSSVRIWLTGYEGNTNPQLMAQSTASPISFLVEMTGEACVVTAQTVGTDGTTSDFATSKTTTVTLDGVVSAPPAPSISQSLIGTAVGYQFSFNQVTLSATTEDVIDGYAVYRNTTGTLDGTQAKINYLKHNPTNTSPIVVTDTLVPASGVFYYYWVSAVNTAALESVLTAAQSGAVAGAIGSIPPTIASGLTYASTTSSITWSWPSVQAILRADGTTTLIGAGSQAVTGLNLNEEYDFYPVYDETTGTLRFISSSDVVSPNVTGVTLNGSTGELTTTSAFVAATSFTFEAWFKTSSAAASNAGIMTHAAAASGSITAASTVGAIFINAGKITCQFIDSAAATKTLTTATTYNDGGWHHVVYVVVGSSSHSIYLDGFQVQTGTLTTGPSTASDRLRIGRGPSNIFFNGTLANVAYYPTALNATQILNHYVSLSTLDAAHYDTTTAADSPSYQWYLSDPTGTTAVDSAGSNTGTYAGGFVLAQTSAALTASGTPAIAWNTANYLALQAQNLRTVVPLSAGSLAGATTASGTGGGGGGGTGGGGAGCFTGAVEVKTSAGYVRFADLPLTFEVTNETGIHKAEVIVHDNYAGWMVELAPDKLVTLDHVMKVAGGWDSADNKYASLNRVWFEGTVYTIHVHSFDSDDQHFILWNGDVAHNKVCFSGNTRLQTRRGNIRFDELQIGDEVLTARGTWKRVSEITSVHYCGPMLSMGGDEYVTPGHLFKNLTKWIRAGECMNVPTVQYDGTIWNAHIDTDENDDGSALDTEHSYTLANGIVAHNVLS